MCYRSKYACVYIITNMVRKKGLKEQTLKNTIKSYTCFSLATRLLNGSYKTLNLFTIYGKFLAW